MGELPGVKYDAEFTSLGAARRHFDIPAGRDRRNADRAMQIAALRQQGCTQVETARRLGISERTVRIYEKSRDRQFSL
jgi:DNA-binding NarL/FixJ family response regulator